MHQSTERATASPSGQEADSLSAAELSLLAVFRKFMMGSGEMLCFFGPMLEKHRRALARLTDQGLLVKERFRGGYALTPSGYAAMTEHGRRADAAERENRKADRRQASANRAANGFEKRRPTAGRRR